jgi:hypothetical protein
MRSTFDLPFAVGEALVAAVLVALTGCSSDSLLSRPVLDPPVTNTDGVNTAANPPTTVEEVAATCKSSTHHTSVQDVFFPENKTRCAWGENDNIPFDPATEFAKYEDVITARKEEKVSLSLPGNALICDLNFDIKEQQMLFDDEIGLVFNDTVLAFSFDYSDRLPSLNGLVTWDWTTMKGSHYQQSDGKHPYCLGGKDGLGTCTIPPTQTTGKMTLDFAQSLVQSLSVKAIESNRYDFLFITTGDNNQDIDCAHGDFRMGVTVDYVELK